MNYEQLDNMSREQDLFLALAVYDWNYFGDARIFRLKGEFGVTAKNEAIFHYYYTNKPHVIELNHERITAQHKALLSAVLCG